MVDEESVARQGGDEAKVLHDLDTGQIVNEFTQAPVYEGQRARLSDCYDSRSNLSTENGASAQQSDDTDFFGSGSNLSMNSGTSTHKDIKNDPANTSDTDSQSNQPNTSDADSQSSEPKPHNKKRKHFNLESYLRSIPDGKFILGVFYERKTLTASQRALLNRLIIKSFTDDALKSLAVGEKLERFTIPTAVFEELAEAIALLFPGESPSVYFTPYKSENGIRFQTSGGLWDHYNYIKEKLRKNNQLVRAKTTKPTEEHQHITVEDVAKVSWLEGNVSPWDKVREYWIATFTLRRRKLLVENLSVTAYINSFPCLRLQEGKELIQQDFDRLYPGQGSSLLSRWDVIKRTLIQQLTVAKIKHVDDSAYIKLLPTLASEAQDAVILYLLPLLIDTGRQGRPKKNESSEAVDVRKYTLLERRESFIHHVEISSDITGSLERLRERALKLNLSVQPILVIVGNLLKIEQVFVQVEDQRYEANSFLEALDLTFKLFFVLECHYPKASTTLWQFIQLAGFKIHVPGTKAVKSVNVLLGLIDQAFRNN